MNDWIAPAIGGLLLLLLGHDVFSTAFHAQGRGGPINRKQNRAVWRLVRWLATRGGGVRPGVLSLAGPLMAVTTVAVWSMALIAAFALVYLPFVPDFHYSPGQPGAAALEAFYYSGIVAATLGQGDVVAPDGWLRVITVLQALAGFAAVTVAVTYVLAVYREISRAQALAAGIHAHLAGRDAVGSGAASSAALVERRAWERAIALELTHVLEAHYNYPILHYFRPREKGRGLPYQLLRLFDRAGEDQGGQGGGGQAEGGEGAGGGGATSVSHEALMEVIHRYALAVHGMFVRGTVEAEATRGRDAQRLAGIVRMMAYPAPEEDGAASDAVGRRR